MALGCGCRWAVRGRTGVMHSRVWRPVRWPSTRDRRSRGGRGLCQGVLAAFGAGHSARRGAEVVLAVGAKSGPDSQATTDPRSARDESEPCSAVEGGAEGEAAGDGAAWEDRRVSEREIGIGLVPVGQRRNFETVARGVVNMAPDRDPWPSDRFDRTATTAKEPPIVGCVSRSGWRKPQSIAGPCRDELAAWYWHVQRFWIRSRAKSPDLDPA